MISLQNEGMQLHGSETRTNCWFSAYTYLFESRTTQQAFICSELELEMPE